MRLDQYLVTHQYYESRNKAAAAVKQGTFAVNGKPVLKPAYEVSADDIIEMLKNETTYVARSAHKLIRAFERFSLEWHGKVIADLGASTGGFCQVLLKNNAQKIYAVDIGTAQLHPSMKSDPRIVNMEHTNARYIDRTTFPEPIQCITADLSFISIKSILPAIFRALAPGGEAVVLVKPQFEAGPQNLSKSGVVSDRKLQYKILEEIALLAESIGFGVKGITFSGLAGESGNREFLLYLEKGGSTSMSITAASHDAVYSEE